MKSKIIPISGDASFRKFYRVISKNDSKIIVEAKRNKYKNLIAYLAVNKFLRNNKILAPKLYNYNHKKNILVIEDFGDESFYKLLKKKKNKLKIYKKIVEFLLSIQKIKPKKKIKSFFGKTHLVEKYSIKYLEQESNLFFKWYLPLVMKKKKIIKIEKKIKKILLEIYKKINLPNSYFVHKDFHVQNIMKVGNKIGVIDTQDALIGNPAYDLVSLIDDVRIKTSKKLKNQIYKYYIKKTPQISKFYTIRFLEDFDILSVQRSLKIIGIFSRLYKRDKKKKYLKFLPYTWKLLEMRMNSKTFSELRKILDKNISKQTRKNIIIK